MSVSLSDQGDSSYIFVGRDFIRVFTVVIFVVFMTSLSGFVFQCRFDRQAHIQPQTERHEPQYFLVLKMMTSSFSSTSISGPFVVSMYSLLSKTVFLRFVTLTLALLFEFDLLLLNLGFDWSLITVVLLHFDFLAFFLLSLFLYFTLVCSSSSF